MFVRQRSNAVFTKEAFYVLLVKMFFEANPDLNIGSAIRLSKTLTEYLKTLEFFQFISERELVDIVTHIISLISHFIDNESGSFNLDKFFAFYSMILTKKDELNFETGDGLEDWPMKFVEKAELQVQDRGSLEKFLHLQKLLSAYKDSKIEIEGKTNFLLGQGIKSGKDLKAVLKKEFLALFRRIKDLHKDIQPIQHMLLKMLLKMFIIKSAKGMREVKVQLERSRDSFKDVKLPDGDHKELKFIIKSMLNLYRMASVSFSSMEKAQVFGFKMLDYLVNVSHLDPSFLLKSLGLTQLQVHRYTAYKLGAMFKVAKDLEVKLDQPTFQAFISGLLNIMTSLSSHKESETRAHFKRLVDNLNIPKTAYTNFILKQLLSLGMAGSIFRSKKQETKIIAQTFKDKLIEITPGLVKFMIKSKLISKQDIIAYSNREVNLIAKKFKDYKINVVHRTYLLLQSLIRSVLQANVTTVKGIKLLAEKQLDRYVHVSSGAQKFLINSLITGLGPSFSSSKRLDALVFEKAVMDQLVKVDTKTNFLLRSLLQILKRASYTKVSQMQMKMVRLRDMKIEAYPGVQKFLIDAVLKLSRAQLAIEKRADLKWVGKKFVDRMIQVAPGVNMAFLRSLLLTEGSVQAYVVKEIRLAFQRMKDYHIKVEKQDIFLINSLQTILGKFEFNSASKLAIFMTRFKDQFIKPKTGISFLIRAIMLIAAKQVQVTTRVHLRSVFRAVKDEMIRVQPAVAKFLLKADLSLSFPVLAKKISVFSTFWTRIKDFFLSPLSLDKFLLSQVMFSGAPVTLKRLASLGLRSNVLRDFHTLVTPGAQKFLLTSFLHFMSGVQFYNRQKLKLYLQNFCDTLVVPKAEQNFLLASFLKLAGNYVSLKNGFLTLHEQKFKDNFISVDIPGKFLVESLFSQKQDVVFKKIMALKAKWQGLRDFLISPFTPGKFLIYNELFMNHQMNVSVLTHSEAKLLLRAARDFHVLVQPGMPKFLIKCLRQVMLGVEFFNQKKLNFALQHFVDNFIMIKTEKSFLVHSLLMILTPMIMKTKRGLRIDSQRLYDYYIHIETPGKFLLQSQMAILRKTMRKSLDQLRTFYSKMRDFLVSPLGADQFVIWNLLVSPSTMKSMQKMSDLTIIHKKMKDFHVLVKPGVIKFLISALISVFRGFSFSNIKKYKFLLSHFVDQFVLTKTERSFLITSLLAIGRPAFEKYKRLTFRTMYSEFYDKFIPIAGHNFLISANLNIKGPPVSLQKLNQFKAYWQGYRDFFVTPLTFKQFLILNIMFLPSRVSIEKLDRLKIYQQALQDYHVLVQPDFGKFLLNSLVNVSSDLRFNSLYKLSFFLSHFMDALIIPDTQKSFLLRAFIGLIRPEFAIGKKLDLKTIFSHFMDEQVHVDRPGKFLVKSELMISSKALAKRVRNFSTFWQRFQDFLVTPEPINKFLLSAIIFTAESDDSAMKQQAFANFGVRLEDYHILVQPGAPKFLISNLFHLLKGVEFSSKSKLRLFCSKFVDGLNLPWQERSFLIKSIFNFAADNFVANKEIDVRTNFKRVIDAFIPIERPGLFLINAELNVLSPASAVKFHSMSQQLSHMKDFFISPLGPDQFVIMSLLLNTRDVTMEKALKVKSFSSKLKDFLNLPDLSGRIFLLQSLLETFSDLRASSMNKIQIVLSKMLDSFILTKTEHNFLINSLLAIMAETFSAYKRFHFSSQFSKMVDNFITVAGREKFLIKSELSSPKIVKMEKMSHFKMFLHQVQDYLVVPITFDWMLYSLIVLKGGPATVLKSEFLSSDFKILQDHPILVDRGFVLFLIRSVLQVTQPVVFANEQKLRFCLSHIIDSLIQVDSVAKFLINFMMEISTPNFTAQKQLSFHGFFSKMTDGKIDVQRDGSFLLSSSLMSAMEEKYAMKIRELKLFFQKFQDFLITPERLDKFLISSMLSLKIPDVSFLKSLDLEAYLRMMEDYHNLVDPGVISFLLFSLIETSDNVVFESSLDLKAYLSKFLDHFVEADLLNGRERPFLLRALIQFFQDTCVVTHDTLSFMAEKYLDRYIQVQPENKFLLEFLLDAKLQKSMTKTLRVKFLYKKLKDEHVQVQGRIKFYISSFLGTRGITSVNFMRDLKIFSQKTRDYLIHIKGRNFLIQSLLMGDNDMAAEKRTSMHLLLRQMKDEQVEPSPLIVIFLLKNLIMFFGDIEFKSENHLKVFLQRYMDYYCDVLTKNTMVQMDDILEDSVGLKERRMDFSGLMTRLHLFWLKQPIKGLNLRNERHVYEKFLNLVHANSERSASAQKMFYLKQAIKGLNLQNMIQGGDRFTVENQQTFLAGLFNLRMKFIKKDFHWGIFNEQEFRNPIATIGKMNLNKVFEASKIIPYVKSEESRIESKNKETAMEGHGSGKASVMFQRSRLKAFALGEAKGEKHHEVENTFVLNKAQAPDDLSKTMVKELTHNALRKFETEEDKYQVMFHGRQRLEDDMNKLELKALQFNTLRRQTEKRLHLKSLATGLKGLKDDLEKTVLKALEFEDRPAAPKMSGLLSVKAALMTSLKQVNNKLHNINKIFLKEALSPVRLTDVEELQAKLQNKGVMTRLKGAVNEKAFSKTLLKIMDEGPGERPNDVHGQEFQGFTSQVPGWLLSKGVKSPESLLKVVLSSGTTGGNKKKDKETTAMKLNALKLRDSGVEEHAEADNEEMQKVILFAGTKGGNKKTDKPVLNLMGKLISFLELAVKQRNGARLDEDGKVILFAPTTGGNKKTDKPTLFKKLVSEMKELVIKKRGDSLKPEELAKILLKFVESGPLAPKLKQAIMLRAKTQYPKAKAASSVKDLVKILLFAGTVPGNKRKEREPNKFSMNAQNEAEDQMRRVKLVIEAAKKVLLKTEPFCCCCCEYFVTECCQEEQEEGEWGAEEWEEEGWGKEEIQYVQQASKQMLADGVNPETHADEFEELVQRLEDADDFECESGPRNMVYNILPEVSFELGLKTAQGFDQELTETRDITHIVGKDPMYRVDGDFAQKMAETGFALDPKQIRPRRPNLYYQEAEYIRAERMNEYLQRQMDEEPEIFVGKGKARKPFEVMDDFKGKDFHEEHHQTRNWREAQYSLSGEEGMDHFYERMLKSADSIPKLQIEATGELSKADVNDRFGETVDKL